MRMAEYLLYSQVVSASLEDFILRVALKLGSSPILDTVLCRVPLPPPAPVSFQCALCCMHPSRNPLYLPTKATLIWGEISSYLRVLPNNLQMGRSLVTVTVIGNF